MKRKVKGAGQTWSRKKASCHKSNPRAKSVLNESADIGRHKFSSFLGRHWKFIVTTVLGLLTAGTINITCSSHEQVNNQKVLGVGSSNIQGSENQSVAGFGNIAVNGDNNTIRPSVVLNGNLIINHITLNCDDRSLEMYSVDEALKGVGLTPEKIGLPKLRDNVLLRDPPGLARVADAVEQHYVAGRLKEAFTFAQIGRDIIDPKLTPYLNKTCSIETAFATHITAVYLILAEEAWSRNDFQTARRYTHLVVGLWGERVTGDVYAFAGAVEINERGGSDSILCEEAVRRFNAGDLKWLHQYLNRLARWGYIHPVAVDDKGTAYHFDYAEAFGLSEKLAYAGPYMKATFPTKDGRMLGNGELIVMIYRGFGRTEAGYIPDPEGRQIPKGFTGSLRMPTAWKVGNQPRPGPEELKVNCADKREGGVQ